MPSLWGPGREPVRRIAGHGFTRVEHVRPGTDGVERILAPEELATTPVYSTRYYVGDEALRRIGRPVFLAGPAVWDGMFMHWYFMRFLGNSPFSASGAGIDLRSYWMGLTGCEWASARKSIIKQRLRLTNVRHTHHAGEDAAELAQVFEAVLNNREGISDLADA